MPSYNSPIIIRRLYVPLGLVVVLVVLAAVGQIATIQPIKDARSVAAISNGGTAFDPTTYVDSIWKSRVIPDAEKNAVPVATLVPELQSSPKTATSRYGNDVGGSFGFLVEFSGTVTKVDTSTPLGSIIVNSSVGGKELPIKVQIGPVILGTSLRDSLKFISFGQFLNQVQYGSVADALNARVEKDVVSALNLKSLPGKTVNVRGAYTYDGTDAGNIVVTPIVMATGQ